MAKLRLNLDQLAVDSFDTAPAGVGKGTVFGEQACTCPGCSTCGYTHCGQRTCAPTCDTCNESCGGSCRYTECFSNPTCDPTITEGAELCHCCPA